MRSEYTWHCGYYEECIQLCPSLCPLPVCSYDFYLLCCNCFLQSAPPQLLARGRSDDLTTILSVIDDAQKLIYISVMDYLPLSEYTEPLRWQANSTHWEPSVLTIYIRGIHIITQVDSLQYYCTKFVSCCSSCLIIQFTVKDNAMHGVLHLLFQRVFLESTFTTL